MKWNRQDGKSRWKGVRSWGKDKKLGMQWQVFFCFAFFTGCIILLLWLFQIVFLEDFYKFIKTSSVQTAAGTIQRNLDLEREDFVQLVDRLSQNGDMCIRVVDSGGMDLYSAEHRSDCVIHTLPPAKQAAYYLKAVQNGGSYLERFVRERENWPPPKAPRGFPIPPLKRMESILYIRVVHTPEGNETVLMLNSTISPVHATVQTLRIQLICLSAVLLLFALLLSVLVSRWLSRPITKINQAAKSLQRGEYNVAFHSGGYREISELADTLNTAARELSKTEGLRQELIANVSHDLRTPLTMITGYAEVMRDIPGENTPENVQIIIDEAKRLSSLVSDILDLSKLQMGTQKLDLSVFCITQTVEKTLKRYQKLTEQDGYAISFSHQGEAVVRADELRISQIIYNLINNAIAYTGEDKVVEVRQILLPDAVRIEVLDTGAGIPSDQLALVWDRYYKLDKSHKRAVIGTGLGLSIVRSVVELHQGQCGVESEEGKGSTFWFSIPREREKEEK